MISRIYHGNCWKIDGVRIKCHNQDNKMLLAKKNLYKQRSRAKHKCHKKNNNETTAKYHSVCKRKIHEKNPSCPKKEKQIIHQSHARIHEKSVDF